MVTRRIVPANRAAKMFSRARRYRRRLRRRTVMVLAIVGAGLVGTSLFIQPRPLIIYNASASAPLGFYRVLSENAFRRGDLVLVKTPDSVRGLAAARNYLPLNVDLVKRIAALQSDRVCAINGIVSINGKAVVRQLAADNEGRPLPRWSGCQVLGAGEVFLLMEKVPDSFDSRYFGPVRAGSIIGRLVPIWLR
jgi:conjugative transfer signal peptidase TraF